MSSGVGSLVLALRCAAKKISLLWAMASSSAAMLRSRPTNSCETMCGNTMMSRSGNAGTIFLAPCPLPSFLKNMGQLCGRYRLWAFSRHSIGGPSPASTDPGFLMINDERRVALVDGVFVDDDFFDARLGGHVVHDVEHGIFHDRA